MSESDSCLTNPYTGKSVDSLGDIDTYVKASGDTAGSDITIPDAGRCIRDTNQDGVTTHMCDMPREAGPVVKDCYTDANGEEPERCADR